MYHGHYFRLDTDVTNIEKGIAVFRYCPDGKTDSNIYVTFTDSEIEFNSIGGDPDRSVMVLHIPIDDNIERSFASTVTESFHWKIEETAATLHEISYLSYYSTFHFGLNSKHPKYWKKPNASNALRNSPSILEPLTVSKIILDFLFDLRETSVFQMSPYYGKLNEKLHQNFFARCLLAKARYWYQRAICEESIKKGGSVAGVDERKKREEKKQFYGVILFEAEKEWTTCIRDLRSDKTFYEEFHVWFDDCETEMRRIYRPYLSIRPNKEILRDIRKEHNKLVSKWFVARYSGLTSWRVFLAGHGSFFGMHLFLPRLFFANVTAWFTLAFFQDIEKTIGKINILPFVLLILFMIFIVSTIVVQRVVPFTRNILVRSLKLSGLVMLVSGIVGCVLLSTINLWNNFIFILFSAAFVGLVLHIFLPGDNPSESL